MEWNLKTFDELSNLELYQILKIRMDIFMLEQNCLYPELDNKDMESRHLFLKESDKIVAYCRIIPPGVSYPQPSIGRVLVKESHRGRGLAKDLMIKAISFLKERAGESMIKIQAQSYLEMFYGSLGFKPISAVYLEDDIPHIDMVLSLDDFKAQ